MNDEPQEREAISSADVLSALHSAGLVAEPTLAQMYQLHNGVYHLDAFLHFLSLQDALASYGQFAKFKEEFQDFGWEPSWLPIFDMNGDVQVCLDLNSGRLITIDMEGDSIHQIASHFTSYVDALYEVFSTGKYRYEPVSGSIEVDESFWAEVARKYGIVGIGEIW